MGRARHGMALTSTVIIKHRTATKPRETGRVSFDASSPMTGGPQRNPTHPKVVVNASAGAGGVSGKWVLALNMRQHSMYEEHRARRESRVT